MKDLETLKKEQYDLKAKLHEIVELVNSEEYYDFDPREKSLISQQRVGMEMYLNSLTKRIYGKDEPVGAMDTMWLPLLFSMVSSPWSSSAPSSPKYELNKEDFEEKGSESEEETLDAVPV